jgi:pimeloyl-ACP methyl ester carboxylesterase
LPRLVAVSPEMTAEEARDAHRENLGRLMFADPGRVDDLAVLVQMDNLRRARFRSGAIPTSDALVKALGSIRARICGIWGAQDAFVGPSLDEHRRALAAAQPGLDFRAIEGAGHWVNYEAAGAVNTALCEMLGAPDDGGAPPPVAPSA